jgi:UDP-N-acetylmuramate--alanine ligase
MNNYIPLNVGELHFIGIGGIGMSGVAEILHNLGYKITGSDVSENDNIFRLNKLGIKTFLGHKPENVKNAAVVVKSTAIKDDNLEIIEARKRKIPIISRSEMLAEITRLKNTIAITGCHGKTTTTSLVGHLFTKAGLKPTIINGGILNNFSSNALLGEGNWIVAEADESDGTFIKIPSTIGIVTNIDREHLDYWKSYKKLIDAYKIFIKNLPFYGFSLLCYDDKLLRKFSNSPEFQDKKIYTYSLANKKANFYAKNIRYNVDATSFDFVAQNGLESNGLELKGVQIPLFGKHNVQNAVAVIALGLLNKIPASVIKNAFLDFKGVKRRFSKEGEYKGTIIIDDYGHHPAEISATLSSARQVCEGKIITVFQPHRFTRFKDQWLGFLQCFALSDFVIVLDIYPASEEPIKGITSANFANELSKKQKNIIYLSDRLGKGKDEIINNKELAKLLKSIIKPKDYILCTGAGDITYIAKSLEKNLGGVGK